MKCYSKDRKMAKTALPPSYYELRLLRMYGKQYKIVPLDDWHGLRSSATIICAKHNTQRKVWLQKVFNGRKNSTWPCRQCYLDSLKPSPTCGGNCAKCKCATSPISDGNQPTLPSTTSPIELM